MEANLQENIGSHEGAREAFMSPWHFHWVFKAMVGETPGDYLRKRRLTNAAQELVGGDKRIIEIAIDHQFESQESFSRAFKKHVGMTPGQYRKIRPLPTVLSKRMRLTERELKHRTGGMTMRPKIVSKDGFSVIGMVIKTTIKENAEGKTIPRLWDKFNPRVKEISNVSRRVSYGICVNEKGLGPKTFNETEKFNYMAAVPVKKPAGIPKGMAMRTIPAQKYAVFTHKDSLDNLQFTLNYIYGIWVAKCGYELAPGPELELYDHRFKFGQQNSELDIYVPIR